MSLPVSVIPDSHILFIHNDSEQRCENRLGVRYYKMTKFMCLWLPLLALATTSLSTRLIVCKNLSSDECMKDNTYLPPVELASIILGSFLIFEKFVKWALDDNLECICSDTNEQEI